MKKKHGWKYWYPKLDTLFSLLIRSKGFCEMCGSRNNQLHCSHIIPRTNHTLRWDVMNALSLCAFCHKWKWHEHPLAGADWFRAKYPERNAYLEIAQNVSIDRIDEDYQKIKEAILKKDFKHLIIDLDKLS